VFGLCETFLRKDESLHLDGYTWYGKNRRYTNKRAKRGSGGVGAFIKNSVLEHFNVDILDSNTGDILWLKLTSRCYIDFKIVLCVCYLPPVCSSRVNDAEQFFETLLEQLYTFQNEGTLCICGDFNSRVGSESDFVEGVDCIPDREVIDTTHNSYGTQFIDFLTECNLCMLNGRVGRQDFTYIKNGSSVVDYVITAHEQLNRFSNFDVIKMSSLVDGSNIPDSIPDHSILTWELAVPGHSDPASPVMSGNTCKKQYVKGKINNTFLQDVPAELLNDVITNIERKMSVQNNVSDAYDEFVSFMHCELDKCAAPPRVRNPGSKVRLNLCTNRTGVMSCKFSGMLYVLRKKSG